MLKNKSDNKREELYIPDWHIEIVRQRLVDYSNNPEMVIDFDEAMDNIEKELNH